MMDNRLDNDKGGTDFEPTNDTHILPYRTIYDASFLSMLWRKIKMDAVCCIWSYFELTLLKDTTHIAFTDNLWDVFCGYWGHFWTRGVDQTHSFRLFYSISLQLAHDTTRYKLTHIRVTQLMKIQLDNCKGCSIYRATLGLCCQKQVSQAGISNYIRSLLSTYILTGSW